ncbi:hypothetical protein JKA74_06675 [Marivirga sp. S37H4]|uniref:LVIVD repeat-containing protein n=1 Tax=Marivirga aurantiaca TaxID=2802615 RepID=A0A935C741_9BACT|nr:hypothetical protein [Marivirga aurantiaca]MBK6264715.1 hypothetical protein [Marivirga aurantiaca]
MKKSVQVLTFNCFPTLLILMALTACDTWEPVPSFDVAQVEGFRPIYATESEIEIKSLTAQEIENPGKIYVINEYLLVVDRLKGIHVFDNTHSENPQNIGFIQIAGSNDIAIRNNILYVDQARDLLAIDISNPANVQLASRVKNVFPFASQHPQEENTYYECPDSAKGVVIGWERATLNYPECYH